MVDASMSPGPRRPSFGPIERRRAALFAGSILVHIAILAPLALRYFEKPIATASSDEDIPIFIQMEPRPLLPGEVARVTAPASARTEATPSVGEVAADRSTPTAANGQSEAMPSPLSPRIAAEARANAAAACVRAARPV